MHKRFSVFLQITIQKQNSHLRPKQNEYRMSRIPGQVNQIENYALHQFSCGAIPCRIAAPKYEASGRPWVWRARFWWAFPEFDRTMLERGWHVAHIDVTELYGGPEAIDRWNSFYDLMVHELNFASQPAIECMSRGGLISYNWAARNPEKVLCMYADNPVCDFTSWPGGKGSGPGNELCWQTCLDAYGLSEEEALAYKGNPIDNLKPLIDAGVPLLHVYGDEDEVVPYAENSGIMVERARSLGYDIELIRKPGMGHHPHCLEDPSPIVTFVEEAWRFRRVQGQPVIAADSGKSNVNKVQAVPIAVGDSR